MPTVRDLLTILHQITPESLAEAWDNVGLLVGDPNDPVHRVLLALDPTCPLIDHAAAGAYDLVVTHHPLIFKPLKAVRTDEPAGRFIATAIRHRIGVIACHTNLDATQGGVNDHLAQALGLTAARPLLPSHDGDGLDSGLGRIGTYPVPVDADVFLERVRRVCAPPWILEAGPRPTQVSTVAVCGGSGSDFAMMARQLGADVLVTAEIKHALACWAQDAPFWLIDAGHFATEYPALTLFRDTLRQQLQARSWDIPVDTAVQNPPLNLA